MITVTITEAKANLSGLLKKVEDGEEVIITRRGQPIAKIIAIRSSKERADKS
jgi:prevent-host-death family protein